MLPHADRDPACFFKLLIGVSVACPVSRDLVRPPRCVRSRHAFVMGTAVPEAAVYKDCYPRPEEDDVCRTATTRYYLPMKAVAEPQRSQRLPKLPFGRRIANGLTTHASADFE